MKRNLTLITEYRETTLHKFYLFDTHEKEIFKFQYQKMGEETSMVLCHEYLHYNPVESLTIIPLSK